MMSMNQLPRNQQSHQLPIKETSSIIISAGDSSSGMSRAIILVLQRVVMPQCASITGIDLNPARKVIAEMVGTFILMFCIYGIIAMTQLLNGQVGLLEYAVTAGLAVVIVVFSVGHISGAHVNPAVTITFAVFGFFPWSQVPFYVIAHIIGSSLAALTASTVYGVESSIMTTRPSHGSSSAFWLELFAMFFIFFTTASISNNLESVGSLSGLVMGIAIALAVLITAPISGGSLNPARSLGPAIVSREFNSIWIYVTAPIVGAVMGALLYRIIHFPTKAADSNLNSADGTDLLG